MARQERDDEIGERMRVLVYSVERFFLVRAAQMAEARPGRVDEDQVARIEQAVFIVDEPIRSRRTVLVVRRQYALRAEGAHMQPHGRGARAAVVKKRNRPLAILVIALEVSDVRHAGFGRLRRRGSRAVGGGGRRIVIERILQVNDEYAGLGLIGKLVTAHVDGALRSLALVRQMPGRFLLVGGAFGLGSLMLCLLGV
jgi:hypothetical protein